MKRQKQGIAGSVQIKAGVFFLALLFFMLLSLVIPARQQESEIEKRKMQQFPDFSVATLLSGEYFDGIEGWFADTFPFKETVFMKINANIRALYGFGDKVTGPVQTGDEIPDTPYEG